MITQMQLIAVICEAIKDHGQMHLSQCQVNAVILAANAILAALRNPEPTCPSESAAS